MATVRINPHTWTPEMQIAARRAVKLALRDGVLVRLDRCERCRLAGPTHAHHHNGYAPEDWLNVVFICADCHSREHHGDRRWYSTRRSDLTDRWFAARLTRSPEDLSLIGRMGADGRVARSTPEDRSDQMRRAAKTARQRYPICGVVSPRGRVCQRRDRRGCPYHSQISG